MLSDSSSLARVLYSYGTINVKQMFNIESGAMRLLKLKEWRERRALTQEQLAEKAGVSRGTIIRIEAGEQAHPPTVRKLADALGVDPGELIGGQV